MKINYLSLILVGALLLTSCNYPGAAPALPATPTVTETLSIPPTPLPTDTPAEPPTDTPEPPPTETIGPPPPTIAPPTATTPPTATRGMVTPIPGALFKGTFPGGDLTFRVHANGRLVIPKTVTLRGAECKEGGKINDQITFEPPPQFEVENAQFTMSQGTQVTISGRFNSSTSASGTITLKLKAKKGACSITSAFQATTTP